MENEYTENTSQGEEISSVSGNDVLENPTTPPPSETIDEIIVEDEIIQFPSVDEIINENMETENPDGTQLDDALLEEIGKELENIGGEIENGENDTETEIGDSVGSDTVLGDVIEHVDDNGNVTNYYIMYQMTNEEEEEEEEIVEEPMEEIQIPLWEMNIQEFETTDFLLFMIFLLLLVQFIHNLFKGSHWFRW